MFPKESACSAGGTGDMGSIPGSERSPGEGNGNPFHCSHLKNPTDRGAYSTQSCKESDTIEQISTPYYNRPYVTTKEPRPFLREPYDSQVQLQSVLPSIWPVAMWQYKLLTFMVEDDTIKNEAPFILKF